VSDGREQGFATAHARIRELIAQDVCVLLDGGIATELPPEVYAAGGDERVWGMSALIESPERVARVHRSYVDAGCDVITTNTWGLPSALAGTTGPDATLWNRTRPISWTDVARRGIRLARQTIADAGCEGRTAVAFSLNGDIVTPDSDETVRVLARLFREEPPDLILVETLMLIQPSTYSTVEGLLRTGLPVWLSFRRCPHGVCGVYGQHWGGPEGDLFGRAARRFEQLGVEALAINCLPPDHVPGMISWLRDFTDVTLGVYPNLGYHSSAGWRSDLAIGGAEYADMALQWREEGAQLIGGCCGVSPDHIAAAGRALAGTPAGRRRIETISVDAAAGAADRPAARREPPPALRDARGRDMSPLPFPDIVVEDGVFAPTQGSFLLWGYLFKHQLGIGRRCLDIGCGSGILAVQLALNGASHVHAIDIDPAAVENTLTNAFRNGVAGRVTAAEVNLYPWVPEERYELIVASLYQMPVDPLEQVTSHRPADFWGRNLVDHLITVLPKALAPDGVAYLMQLSILSQERTAALLDEHGLEAEVVDFSFLEMAGPFLDNRDQIARVEAYSDAYHLDLGPSDVMVAYLLEVRRRPDGAGDPAVP
jgi:S-methylmethionine-dependent homocysteine/selenocysteine methylase/SAM-dependent methyltransferase